VQAFTLDTTSMISLITTTPDDGVFEIQYRLYNKRSRTYVEVRATIIRPPPLSAQVRSWFVITSFAKRAHDLLSL
jgi:hypothetical protein